MASSSSVPPVLAISAARHTDVDQIVEVGNDAFMADVFFKKPEFHQRFTADRVHEMIDAPHSEILVARSEDLMSDILGFIYLHWDVHYDQDNNPDKVTGKFSAVSVPEKNSKRGIGKKLVSAAEHRVLSVANALGSTVKADIEMGVINQRTDLFPWYENQGFVKYEEIFDAEVDHILLDDLRGKVFCVCMRKHLK